MDSPEGIRVRQQTNNSEHLPILYSLNGEKQPSPHQPHPQMQRPLSFVSGACDHPTAILTKSQQDRRCSNVFNALARTLVEFSAAGNTQQLAIIKEFFSKSPRMTSGRAAAVRTGQCKAKL